MKKILAGLLAVTMLCAFTACGEDKAPQEPSTTTTTTTTSTTQSTTTQPDVTTTTDNHDGMTEAQALRIAKTAVDAFNTYANFSLCCDMEYVEGDFSQFLTDKQLENYFLCQYKITCCQTANQVTEHVRRHLASSLITHNAVEDLFYDDQGALYLLVIPRGGYSLSNVRILEYTPARIIAIASEYGHDSEDPIAQTRLTIENRNGQYIITKMA